MEAIVLDENLVTIGIIDSFESFIWTDRFFGFGDFEIGSAPTSNFISNAANGKYLLLNGSEHVMILETLDIKTSSVEGNKMFIRGRSLETILFNRIIWNQTVLTGNFQDGIELILNMNAIDPTDPDRKISLLVFDRTFDPIITALDIDSQFYGEFLYNVIADLCRSRNIGFRITLGNDNKFHFSLYSGTDRSEDQFDVPYVVFSPSFENVINSDYTETNQFLKTITLVAGEKGIGNGRTTKIVEIDTGAGTELDRREMFTDAAGVTRSTPDRVLTDEEYIDQLTQKGEADLFINSSIKTFEGQIDTTLSYKFGEDFEMGDIVQVENEYGQKGKSRVIEMIFSHDASGIKMYPTFSAVPN